MISKIVLFISDNHRTKMMKIFQSISFNSIWWCSYSIEQFDVSQFRVHWCLGLWFGQSSLQKESEKSAKGIDARGVFYSSNWGDRQYFHFINDRVRHGFVELKSLVDVFRIISNNTWSTSTILKIVPFTKCKLYGRIFQRKILKSQSGWFYKISWTYIWVKIA